MDKVDIIDASFMLSCAKFSQVPQNEEIPEIAFLGRSNVGKSSLLNSLVHRKGLAKSSSTPGKTKLINFFDISLSINSSDYRLRFVDLPGFGYAKVSKEQKKDWEKNLTNFLLQRDSIRLFIQLIDARHINLDSDKEVRRFLNSIKRDDQRIFYVFTKIDKLKKSELNRLKNSFKNGFFVSNLKKEGIQTLRDSICEYLFFIGEK